MVAEVTVTVKNEEKKYISKFLIYESFTVSDNDPILIDCVEKTLKEFGQNDIDSVQVKILMQLD